MSEDWNNHPEDLREASVFQQTKDSNSHILDHQDLRKRLEDLANEPTNIKFYNRLRSGNGALKQCLAKYLLLKLDHSEANTLDDCCAILWSKQSEHAGSLCFLELSISRRCLLHHLVQRRSSTTENLRICFKRSKHIGTVEPPPCDQFYVLWQ